MQFQGKLLNQTWENEKNKLILGPILDRLVQIWAPKNFSVSFTSTICYILLQAIIVCSFKEN